MFSNPVATVIKPRIDRLFAKYLRNGNPQLLTQVLDQAAPELWRVAAHLCSTQHDAEDAVQSTFLAAIEDRTAWDPKRPLMPWLVGVLINRAREQRRKLTREVDPDRVSTPAAPDPAKLAGEREFGRTFAKALRDVTEPYRSVVEQHLVRGIGAADIAAKTGVPAATIRTRLHRGLEQLRKRLPAGAGAMAIVPAQMPAQSMTTVFTAIKNAARAKKTVAASTAIVAATAGFELKKIVLVAAAALIAMTTWQLADIETTEDSQKQQAFLQPQQQGTPTDKDEASSPNRKPSASSKAQTSARVAVSTVGNLHVLARNSKTLQPLVGVQVIAQTQASTRPGSGSETAAPSAVTPEDAAPSMAKGMTDAAGRVQLRIAAGKVRVASPHGKPQLTFVTVAPDEVTEHFLDITADLNADVQVVDEHGAPIPFATILGRPQNVLHEMVIGKADAKGHWREDLTDVSLAVRAATPQLAASPVAMLTEHTPKAVLTLTRKSASIHGIVMDAFGQSVPNATVVFAAQLAAAVSDRPISMKTDDRGRYSCAWLHEGDYQVLVAEMTDVQVKQAMVFSAAAATGDCPPTNLQLTEGASIAAQIRRPDNQPLINHSLQAEYIGSDADRRFSAFLMRHGNTDNDGRCSLRNMMPGRYKLTARFGNAHVAKVIELREGECFDFNHTFARLLSLPIEIVDEANKPRPGVRVTLHTNANQTARKTNSAGRVLFENLAQQDYEVALSTDDAHGFAQARHRLPPSPDVTRLVLPRRLALGKVTGRFDLSSAPLPEGLSVTLSTLTDPLRPGDRTQVDIDSATGEFAVDQLLPGKYFLLATAQHIALASRPQVEITGNSTLDLGTIRLGTGKIRIHIIGDEGNGSIVAGTQLANLDLVILDPRETERRSGANHLVLPDRVEGDHRVILWGEDISRVVLDAHVVTGQTVQLRAQVVPAVRTELRMPNEMGIIELRMPDGSSHRELNRSTKWVRGLAHGTHHVQFAGRDGVRYAAKFEVGTEPSAPVVLRRDSR